MQEEKRMAKLRKMLGHADDPGIRALMAAIETQNKRTLARWAAETAENRYLPVYEKAFPADKRLRALLESAKKCAAGEIPLTALKAEIRSARGIPAEAAPGGEAAVAAARAVVTACGVMGTPANALGFVFYGAAAGAYDTLGTASAAGSYDSYAAAEFSALLAALREMSVPDEPDPVKIDWNC